MVKKQVIGRIAQIALTKSELETKNSVLMKGEIAYETDTNQIKVGDGTTVYKSLPYFHQIIDNVTTNDSTKVLSAKQGKVLQDKITEIEQGMLTVPTATTEKVGGIKSSSAAKDEVVVNSTTGIATVSRVSKADQLTTARSIALSGDVTGSTSFDGSGNVTIAATVADNSHNHTIANVTGLQDALDKKANLASPSLTGTPTAPTATKGTNTTQLATTAFVKEAIDDHIASANALVFKGTVSSKSALPTSGMKVGDLYVVSEAGTYAGQVCEVGDMIIYGTGSTWYVVQKNIDGAVTGPTSSTASHVATFDGTTGKVIKDSGFTIGQSVPDTSTWTIGQDVTDTVHGLMTSDQKKQLETNTTNISTITGRYGYLKDAFYQNGTTLMSTRKSIKNDDGTIIIASGDNIVFSDIDDYDDGEGRLVISTTAEPNVQSDWNVTDTTSDAYILNKPTALKNPNALTFTKRYIEEGSDVSKTYDGSLEVSITASDLGALWRYGDYKFSTGEIPVFNGNSGSVQGSGIKATDVVTKVSSPVAGDLVTLTSDGKIQGAGFTVSKASAAGKFLKGTANGDWANSDIAISDVTNLQTSLDGKYAKVTGAVADNLVAFDSGAVKDSGISKSNLMLDTDNIILTCSLDVSTT